MKIYFAGSIRGGREDKEVYLQIINSLTKYGQVLTEHVGNVDLSVLGEEKPAEDVYERDLAWLIEADVVVAEITTPSLGVGYELGKIDGQKPILCLYRAQVGRKVSTMIVGNKNILTKEYKDISEAEGILKDFFQKI